NTIINYETLFGNLAYQHGWTKQNLSKTQVKAAIIEQYGNDTKWQILQAQVYGKQIHQAQMFTDCYEFIKTVIANGDQIYIISHKTEFSNYDGVTKLIEPARQWLADNKLSGPNGLINESRINFYPSLDEKVAAITAIHCDIFIDDLSRVLTHQQFSGYCIPILFSRIADHNHIYAKNWQEILQFYQLLKQYSLPWLVNFARQQKQLIVDISPFYNGGNNQLKKISTNTKQQFIIKSAIAEKSHLLRNECNALKLLNKQGFDNIPRAIAYTKSPAQLIQTFIPAQKVGQIRDTHLQQVIQFISRLDKIDAQVHNFNNIANARQCIKHYENDIKKRWQLINQNIEKQCQQYECFNLIKQLLPDIVQIVDFAFQAYNKQLKTGTFDVNQHFNDQELCFNPSDFGFHNILEDNHGKLFFIDFEYFVYDDKVKMVSDFIHHAGHKLTLEQKIYFIQQLQENNFFNPAVKQRLILLLDLIGIEWLLIILNIVQYDKFKQKIHAKPDLSVEEIVITQYDKAKQLIQFFQNNIAANKNLFTLGINYQDLSLD
ncbi:MAG: hypothetical protein HQL46_16620, partial [Gammaproteobacteria bacterium]|nr:hypothetical protein [Gammaproteobacteria bacterium]